MKVFNLSCEHDHTFEGWFGSSKDYEQQLADKQLQCPLCNSANVRRLPSAARLNLTSSNNVSSQSKDSDRQEMMAPTTAQMQDLWMRMTRHIQENTEDVGERFADEARAIHYDEAPERGIRGKATVEEAAELADEGIEVLAFPIPAAGKETLN